MEKAKGQQLYEYKSREKVGDGWFPAWRFLTAECKASWEKTAEGHHLFSNEPKR